MAIVDDLQAAELVLKALPDLTFVETQGREMTAMFDDGLTLKLIAQGNGFFYTWVIFPKTCHIPLGRALAQTLKQLNERVWDRLLLVDLPYDAAIKLHYYEDARLAHLPGTFDRMLRRARLIKKHLEVQLVRYNQAMQNLLVDLPEEIETDAIRTASVGGLRDLEPDRQ